MWIDIGIILVCGNTTMWIYLTNLTMKSPSKKTNDSGWSGCGSPQNNNGSSVGHGRWDNNKHIPVWHSPAHTRREGSSHMFYPRPLQQTVPQYVGLDVHLICMRFRPARARWCKKLRSCAAPFGFSSEAPCQANFRPLPSGPQVLSLSAGRYPSPDLMRQSL